MQIIIKDHSVVLKIVPGWTKLSILDRRKNLRRFPKRGSLLIYKGTPLPEGGAEFQLIGKVGWNSIEDLHKVLMEKIGVSKEAPNRIKRAAYIVTAALYGLKRAATEGRSPWPIRKKVGDMIVAYHKEFGGGGE